MEKQGAFQWLQSLTGRMVRLGAKGPESRYGRVVAVKEDYLALDTKEDGVVYYPLHHLKSIVYDGKDVSDVVYPPPPLEPGLAIFDTFQELLESMRWRWVQVNRSGPECLQGVLSDVLKGHVQVIAGTEVCRLFTYHMKNISFVKTETSDLAADGADAQKGAEASVKAAAMVEESSNESDDEKESNGKDKKDRKKDRKSKKRKDNNKYRVEIKYSMKKLKVLRKKDRGKWKKVMSARLDKTGKATGAEFHSARKPEKRMLQHVWLSPMIGKVGK